MSRVKLLLAGLLGALLLSAIGSAAAFAEPTAKCTPNGGVKALTMVCVQKTNGELFVLGLPSLETIEFLGEQLDELPHELDAAGITISCNEGLAHGLIDGNPTESALIEGTILHFEECVVVGLEMECEVLSDPGGTAGLIETTTLIADFENESSEDGAIVFKPASGTTFAEFQVDSKAGQVCPVAILTVVKEKAGAPTLCVVLNAHEELKEEDAELHVIACEKATLEAFGGAAELTVFFGALVDRPAAWSTTAWAVNPPWGIFLTETIS
jgi:hypothetical protein